MEAVRPWNRTERGSLVERVSCHYSGGSDSDMLQGLSLMSIHLCTSPRSTAHSSRSQRKISVEVEVSSPSGIIARWFDPQSTQAHPFSCSGVSRPLLAAAGFPDGALSLPPQNIYTVVRRDASDHYQQNPHFMRTRILPSALLLCYNTGHWTMLLKS
jgi:hypothetical protein